jgi:hypothetical protein
VLEVAIAKGGYRKGFRVAMFIEQWTIAQHALGRVPTLEEAAAWWKESERTWFHRQAEFREIFNRVDTPAPIAAAAIASAQERLERRGSVVSVLGSLAVPDAVAAA